MLTVEAGPVSRPASGPRAPVRLIARSRSGVAFRPRIGNGESFTRTSLNGFKAVCSDYRRVTKAACHRNNSRACKKGPHSNLADGYRLSGC